MVLGAFVFGVILGAAVVYVIGIVIPKNKVEKAKK